MGFIASACKACPTWKQSLQTNTSVCGAQKGPLVDEPDLVCWQGTSKTVQGSEMEAWGMDKVGGWGCMECSGE